MTPRWYRSRCTRYCHSRPWRSCPWRCRSSAGRLCRRTPCLRRPRRRLSRRMRPRCIFLSRGRGLGSWSGSSGLRCRLPWSEWSGRSRRNRSKTWWCLLVGCSEIVMFSSTGGVWSIEVGFALNGNRR
ncbi:hypothetical protein BDW74DRAFT_157059 [Aspergillus multicolor]|uniref:uncharacterized protein n=1 Tax=Aspergillus multicolor TaxID=41759 RepID=UPI003CCE10D8